MDKALINPVMLRWARERVAFSTDRLAAKMKIPVSRLLSWENGSAAPTFRQAETWAKKTHIPFGYLFLDNPPQEALPIPDLRVQEGMGLERPSADFFDLLRNVLFQQDWYRDYRLEHGAVPLPFVGCFQSGDDVQQIAQDIRVTLGMEAQPVEVSNWEQHLVQLCERCEEIGIWVMRSGYVGSNTHRILDVQEFRGFAISDPIVPLIFLNGRDAKAAQIFTLAHELAHIWLNESGISNLRLDIEPSGIDARVEQVCNAVAAEILTPRQLFLDAWQDNRSLEENLLCLSRAFKVSEVVIARRARDLGKIRREQYLAFYRDQQKTWENIKARQTRGGDLYRVIPIKNGRRFTRAVLSSAMSGRLLLRDAGGLLHTSPNTLQNLYRQQLTEGGDVSAGF